MSNYHRVVYVCTKSFLGAENIILQCCEAVYNVENFWTIDYEFLMASNI